MLELMPLLDKRKADPLYMQLYTYIKNKFKKVPFRLMKNCLLNES